MTRRLRALSLRRWLLLVFVLALAGAGLYLFVLRDAVVEPRLEAPRATATIGSGEEAIAVGPRGRVLEWLVLPEELQLPALPLSEPPRRGRVAGQGLEQARVLGAAPAELRPYLEGSYYGDSGVNVELRSGIELRFGDASRLEEKWRSAATVLADPSITTLDYVDLLAPRRPSVGGSGHTLPLAP